MNETEKLKKIFSDYYNGLYKRNESEMMLHGLTKRFLVEYIMDAFDRGWITPSNIGFDKMEAQNDRR